MNVPENIEVLVENWRGIEPFNSLGESMDEGLCPPAGGGLYKPRPDAHLTRRGIKDSLNRRPIERGTYSSPSPSQVKTQPTPVLPLENFSLSAFLWWVRRTPYYQEDGDVTRFDRKAVWATRSIELDKMVAIDRIDEWGRVAPFLVGTDSIGNSISIPSARLETYLDRCRDIRFNTDRGVADEMAIEYGWAIDEFCNFLVAPHWLKKPCTKP